MKEALESVPHKVKEKNAKRPVWTNQGKDPGKHIVDKVDKQELIRLYKKLTQLTKENGNLQVQNAEHSQIVGELSEKLKKYDAKFGRVFTKGA